MRITIIWHGAVIQAGRLWIEELAARPGVSVSLISASSWSAVLPRRVNFEREGTGSFDVHVLKPHLSFHGATFFLSGLKKALQLSNPDVVLAIEEPFSLVMGQILHIISQLSSRLRLYCHTYQNILKQYPFPFSWIEQKTLGRVDGMLGSCPEVLEVLRKKGYGGAQSVFPQSIDPERWRPMPQEVNTQRRRGIHIGYVGRFVPEKGIDTLLAASRQLTLAHHLTLVGNGPLEVIIRQEISGMKYTATILKDLLPLQIAGIYPTFDMLVVPSRTQRNWKEQFGRVLIEGMACGVPVIGSDSGAIPWVIGDAGRIFPEGDAAALANEIRLLAESPELRRELGEKGRARVVEHFSTKVVVDDLLEFIRETAG